MTGLVVDATTSDPVPGATVMIKSSPFAGTTDSNDVVQITVTTDKDGLFNQNNVPIGDVQVVVKKRDTKPPTYRPGHYRLAESET